MDKIHDGLQSLEVYIQARKFRQIIIEICKIIPYQENSRLIDQLKRSSRSVTANIAEGYGRFSYYDNVKFCRYARGSLHETQDHIYVAIDEKYLSMEQIESFQRQYEIVLRLLNGYIAYLKKQNEAN